MIKVRIPHVNKNGTTVQILVYFKDFRAGSTGNRSTQTTVIIVPIIVSVLEYITYTRKLISLFKSLTMRFDLATKKILLSFKIYMLEVGAARWRSG